MPVTNEKVKLCNAALMMLGARPISAFDDGSDAGIICKRLYDGIKLTSLGMYPWSFSFRRINLSRLAAPASHEYEFQYPLPTDRINNIRAVYSSNRSDEQALSSGWVVEGGLLLTDETFINVSYQFQVGEAAMPTYFTFFFTHMIAWNIAEAVTDQLSKAQYFKELAVGGPADDFRGGLFRNAAYMDSQNRNIGSIEGFPLVQVRA